MQVAQAVGEALIDLGVTAVFGVIGSGNLEVSNALDGGGARFVHARHENAAMCMADAYARVTGRVGVATCHQGPGLTNAATGITEAAKARTPLLVLAADTSAAAVRSNFRIDQDALVESCGASAERIHTAQSAIDDVSRAWRRAMVERRTVVLMLPLDVQAQEVTGDVRVSEPDVPRPPAPQPDAVDEVVDLLGSAERPVIVAGRGAVLSDAGGPIRDLGERVGALLATSANGNGLFAGDPYALGISGGFASPVAAELLASADLLLAFGASLNMWTTRHGALVGEDTRVVQVDVDPEALGAQRPVDVGVVADARECATAILGELERRGVRSRASRDPGLADRIAKGRWRDVDFESGSTEDTVDPRELSIALDDLLPAERTVAIDSGHFMGWPAMYLEVPDAAGFVFNQSYQSIGLGLGAAIGAAVARPDRLTVAALGDGGAMMALGELETAAQLDEPLLVVVYNDAAYGAEVHHFRPMGRSVALVQFEDPDLAAYGRSAGGTGLTVRSTGDLGPLEDWLQEPRGLFVVDAKVTPTIVADWLEEAFRAH